MWISELADDKLTDDIVDKVLYEGIEDHGQSADCIIVLGSSKAVQYRVPVAVKAYQDGRAKKILMCGGITRTLSSENRTEAEKMREKAIELGVPKEVIICDENSENTIENFLFAMVELQRAFWLNKMHSVLLVTTSYHMRRSMAIAKYLFPSHIEVYPCPADDNNTRKSNWKDTEEGRKRAIAEVKNIIICVKNGVFPDFEF